jgi:hypothetical protein
MGRKKETENLLGDFKTVSKPSGYRTPNPSVSEEIEHAPRQSTPKYTPRRGDITVDFETKVKPPAKRKYYEEPSETEIREKAMMDMEAYDQYVELEQKARAKSITPREDAQKKCPTFVRSVARGGVLVQHEKNAPSTFYTQRDANGNPMKDPNTGKILGQYKKDDMKWIKESDKFFAARRAHEKKIVRAAEQSPIVFRQRYDRSGKKMVDPETGKPIGDYVRETKHEVPIGHKYRKQRTTPVKKKYVTNKLVAKTPARKVVVKKVAVKKPKPLVRKLKSPKPVMWNPTIKKMALGPKKRKPTTARKATPKNQL